MFACSNKKWAWREWREYELLAPLSIKHVCMRHSKYKKSIRSWTRREKNSDLLGSVELLKNKFSHFQSGTQSKKAREGLLMTSLLTFEVDYPGHGLLVQNRLSYFKIICGNMKIYLSGNKSNFDKKSSLSSIFLLTLTFHRSNYHTKKAVKVIILSIFCHHGDGKMFAFSSVTA